MTKNNCTPPGRSQYHTFSTRLPCKHLAFKTDASHTGSLSVARIDNTTIQNDTSQVVQGSFACSGNTRNQSIACRYSRTIEQVLGIHLGIRHLVNDALYTPEAFKDAAAAVHRKDEKWASPADPYMAKHCPEALEAISRWE